MSTENFKSYTFTIKYKKRFWQRRPKKDTIITEKFKNSNYLVGFARFCFFSEKNVKEIIVTNEEGGFELKYKE